MAPLGKLLYDLQSYDEAKKALNGGNAMISDVRAGNGTLGKLGTDDSLYNNVRDAITNVANAPCEAEREHHHGKNCFSDPQLYDKPRRLDR